MSGRGSVAWRRVTHDTSAQRSTFFRFRVSLFVSWRSWVRVASRVAYPPRCSAFRDFGLRFAGVACPDATESYGITISRISPDRSRTVCVCYAMSSARPLLTFRVDSKSLSGIIVKVSIRSATFFAAPPRYNLYIVSLTSTRVEVRPSHVYPCDSYWTNLGNHSFHYRQ